MCCVVHLCCADQEAASARCFPFTTSPGKNVETAKKKNNNSLLAFTVKKKSVDYHKSIPTNLEGVKIMLHEGFVIIRILSFYMSVHVC